jgi:hypothetical protein
MIKRTIIFFFFLLGGILRAQDDQRLLILGNITSSKDNSPIEGVVIICKDPSRISQSDKKGHYAILVDYKAGTQIEFHLAGFEPLTKTISPQLLKQANGDTLHLDVQLEAKAFQLDTFTIRSGPDTVIGNWHFFIEDYEFVNDTSLILLTFENSLKKAKVMLADINEKIIASTDVPVEAISLMRDYQGHINVMCKDSAFRVKIVPPAGVLLLALPYSDFCTRILPCVDTRRKNSFLELSRGISGVHVLRVRSRRHERAGIALHRRQGSSCAIQLGIRLPETERPFVCEKDGGLHRD